ncbi:hypothetical protein B0I37DRAFT_161208 [Chaetomium sp. MPI-CAGE-AT-0009]|nr:hypothetical protein B0I37DRAFT_161208 [Chaetomium sp. MPI-CAGE-AT-0009]
MLGKTGPFPTERQALLFPQRLETRPMQKQFTIPPRDRSKRSSLSFSGISLLPLVRSGRVVSLLPVFASPATRTESFKHETRKIRHCGTLRTRPSSRPRRHRYTQRFPSHPRSLLQTRIGLGRLTGHFHSSGKPISIFLAPVASVRANWALLLHSPQLRFPTGPGHRSTHPQREKILASVLLPKTLPPPPTSFFHRSIISCRSFFESITLVHSFDLESPTIFAP